MTTQLKRFVASSMQEAVELVKKELGPSAVIYDTRSFYEEDPEEMKGYKKVEVLAGLDEEEKDSLADLVNSQVDVLDIQGMAPASEEASSGKLANILASCGLNSQVISSILQEIPPELSSADQNALPLIKRAILGGLPPIKPLRPNEAEPQIVAFVGPTGVGKTTTIAKLAANFQEIQKESVGLISLDFKRMAALEQIKAYSNAFDLDFEIVLDGKQLQSSLRKFAGKTLILIDTPGLNPFDNQELTRLDQILKSVAVDEIMLVLGLNVREDDLSRITQSFQQIDFSGFIFTKLDETQAWGSLINLAWQRKEHISYVTLGQNVPEDIELLHPQRFLDALITALPN